MRVINFFGGPGAGKSTAAAGLFYELKKRWFRAELVTEFAKELVWAGNAHMLSQQNFIFANQEHRLARLDGQVDVAVSDSPLLLSAYYAPDAYELSFKQSVFSFFSTYENINIFVRRSHRYSAAGRLQNQDEADAIARTMEDFLQDNGIPYYAITASDASPRYLLHWMVHSGMLEMPQTADPFTEDDRPPEGWITPSLLQRNGEDGKPLTVGQALDRRHIDSWVRRVGERGTPEDHT